MYKVEQQVTKKVKASTGILKILMIVLAVLFLLCGIFFNRGYMLFCFIFAGLYFWFESNASIDYEYVYCDNKFEISVIKSKRKRYLAHELDMSKLVVVAPHDHESVSKYKKGNFDNLPKYDYTSYNDDIEYYTMIIEEDNNEIKLLLDLNEEMLSNIKQKYPTKVYY